MQRQGFEEFKAQLLTLTPKQRQQAQALLGSTPEPENTSVGNQILLWDSVCDAWAEAFKGARLAPLAVVRERLGPELGEALEACDVLIQEHMPKATRTQRVSCYRMFVRIVLEYVRSYLPQSALGPKAILQQLRSIGVHMDSMFPGYGKARLLGIVFERLVAER